MRKLSHASQLHNARIARRQAAERCPHWDYESDSDAGMDCCRELDRAEVELHRLLALTPET